MKNQYLARVGKPSAVKNLVTSVAGSAYINANGGHSYHVSRQTDVVLTAKFSTYCDALQQTLTAQQILEPDDTQYSCYLIDRFSVHVSLMTLGATAVAMVSALNAVDAASDESVRYSLCQYEKSIDQIPDLLADGNTALYLGGTPTEVSVQSTIWNTPVLLVVFRDAFELRAA